MTVWVLVIVVDGEQHVTLHDRESDAWSRLIGFVDQRIEPGDCGELPPNITDEERVRLFFSHESHFYAIASADVSEVEASIEAVLREPT